MAKSYIAIEIAKGNELDLELPLSIAALPILSSEQQEENGGRGSTECIVVSLLAGSDIMAHATLFFNGSTPPPPALFLDVRLATLVEFHAAPREDTDLFIFAIYPPPSRGSHGYESLSPPPPFNPAFTCER